MLSTAVAQTAAEYAGSECILLACEALGKAARRLAKPQQVDSQPQKPSQPRPMRMKRCTLWFHHIKSTMKRKHIVNWAKELGLRGYSKPG